MMRITWPITVVLALGLSAFGQKEPDGETFIGVAGLKERITAALDALEEDGDFAKAEDELREFFAHVGARAPVAGHEAFVESAFALRLVRQLGATGVRPQRRRRPAAGGGPPAGRVGLLKYLRANDRLARAMAFTVRAAGERPRAVYDLLEKLRKTHGEKLNTYAYLAAALCVVHDEPLKRRVNENTAAAPDPLAIFKYYIDNEKSMFFGLMKVPPELLIYVVDTTASIEEMRWALKLYRGDRNVGSHFFDIRYDYDHLRKGTKKGVTLHGLTLPNILQYGGICADQAYFAAGIGKAIGVPTCYVSGRGAESAHAWVGFFQAAGAKGAWNFRYGRYAKYCVVRGRLRDPQIRRDISDDHLSLQAEMIGTKEADRYAAVAYVDAARLLGGEAGGGGAGAGNIQAVLDRIEQGLRRAKGYAEAWLMVSRLARDGRMTLPQKKHWAAALQRMCGRKYPDFSMAVIKPMILTIADTAEQNALWETCLKLFAARHDLAAEIRTAQAKMWERAGQDARAGRCYEDIVNRFINAGPFAVAALKKTEEKLRQLNRRQMIPTLYRNAWNRCRRPQQMTPGLYRRSNWYLVGQSYAKVLEQFGQRAAAEQVRATLAAAGK